MTNRPWQRHYDYNVPLTIRYPRIPVHQLLNIPVSRFPNKPATNFYGTEITFWDLKQQIMTMANALGELGIKKGDRIGIQLPNCPQYIIAYYAALNLGAIIVNLNPMYTAEELKSLFSDVGLSGLVTFDMMLPNIRQVCQDVDITHMIVTAITDYIDGLDKSTAETLGLEKGWHHFSALLEKAPRTRLPHIDILHDDPAMIQFTGGTTGLPKGAVLTHGNLVAASMQISLWGSAFKDFEPSAERNVMAALPFFHVYGNIVGLNSGMLNGATQILAPRFEIDDFMGQMANFKSITFFPAVPTMINAIINHPKAEELELGKKLIQFNSGGAPMPRKLIDQVSDMGINYGEGWGMSETASIGLANPILGLKKAGSIGIPFPDNDVKVVDIETGSKEVVRGEPGEMLIKGPMVMKEYWNNPEETAKQLKDGWLNTGDIVVQDEDDFFTIVDRKKDMIIASGYNVYPREIDEVLYQHPKVADAVAVGLPDEYRGETIKAFVVLKPGEILTETEVIEFCKDKLAAYKLPKSVEFRTELPTSPVGKVLRKVLRDEEKQNN